MYCKSSRIHFIYLIIGKINQNRGKKDSPPLKPSFLELGHSPNQTEPPTSSNFMWRMLQPTLNIQIADPVSTLIEEESNLQTCSKMSCIRRLELTSYEYNILVLDWLVYFCPQKSGEHPHSVLGLFNDIIFSDSMDWAFSYPLVAFPTRCDTCADGPKGLSQLSIMGWPGHG
jgi:hypothetical protein